MASVNNVTILGNIGQSPEVKYTTGGDAVCNLSVATSEKWKGKDGEQKEHTEWHRVTLFARLAEIVGEYCQKGSPIYIEGSLRTRKWTDKEGVEKYTTEIHARRVQLLGKKDDGGGEREPTQTTRKSSAKNVDDFDDDIPF